MINVTGLNNKKMYLNSDHIEKIEQVPETIITLTNGKKYIVLETPQEVINRVIEYKRKIFTLGL
ncbi:MULTISPECIES: flagellar FlbD family protein [Clostridium]|uniref:Flagellar protein (FlbD) n=2 Tax=Clostridium TaxID=1485 RepID=A0A151AQ33_9CLOT|nr:MULTISPECIES: flagellar FlbD family protein [Clostridium]KYH29749.1 flagellar protein (FlbD) [Clostridium colicanis DSM 13634]MBE6044738.1 endoflagellar protein [Clostridium thermopalmarium]PRR75130.1 Flagellar protein FlbD [Clostridium thermopalmarium DSM 5974]PVZ27886.1 flagellar protein FlbD [Clostridium thermopalmarium DSM 5974]